MSLASLSGRAFPSRKLLTPKTPPEPSHVTPGASNSWGSPNDRHALGSPGAAGARYLSLCHSWRAAAAHPPRAGLSVPGGCCSLMPSVRPSAGAVAGGPPGQHLLPRFPCPRADITAQRRSPAGTQGDGGWEDTGRRLTPLEERGLRQHRLHPEHSTLRSLSFPPHGPPRETEARVEGRGTHCKSPLHSPSDRFPWRPPALPNQHRWP